MASEAKYRRAAITLQLGVPEIWMEDGSEARIVAAIEQLFNSNASGVGPGGSVLHAMFVLSWKPGDVAKLPTGAEIEPMLEKWRAEYPLRTKDEVQTDFHEPPGYPSRSLEWPEESRHADRCPTCSSRMPQLHPSAGEGGEVTARCPDVWHGTPMAGRDFDIDGNPWE